MYDRLSTFSSLLTAALLLIAAVPLGAGAQDIPDRDELMPEYFNFHEGVSLDPDIPAPGMYIGAEPGTTFTLHADVISYLETLDAASDRISLQEYGRTYEDRPLIALFVTSPDNHDRLEQIRSNNMRLADPSLPDDERDGLLANQPVITWLSYNVHGNEPSSTEAAMQVAYRLAAATDAETARLLDETVVVIDPVVNPDGRDRYVYWYKSMRSHQLRTDARELEHDEPWPGGRTNHYWFDLNRDWVWLVHPESRGRISVYREWLPQVHLDYHEQGYNSNYFTMPGQEPRNLNLPVDYEDWADTFGRGHASAFDQARVNYFTRQAFDFFYPGYGSSYPSNLGAIGMLAEQGGHSRGGRAVETNDGYVLTLRQRIFDHYTTSLETVRTAVENRRALLEYFGRFFSPQANKSDTKVYFIEDDGGSGWAYHVIGLLREHDITVQRLSESARIRRAFDYWTGQPKERTFEAGTFVVPATQARHVLVNTLMQRQMAIEDSVMYDMATWSIPLAYNLDAAWTTDDVRIRTEEVPVGPFNAGELEGTTNGYAYVVDWEQARAPQALAMLWDAGYRVRSAEKTFSDGEQTFGRGTLVVLRGRNRERGDRMDSDMRRIAKAAGVRIVGMESGRMEEGIDLASSSSRPVDEPKVALLVDRPFSTYASGQLWFLFDRWTGFGIDRIRGENFSSLDLNEYDVLLLPGGNPGSVMDSTQVDRLENWVTAGGTLVATERSASFFTKKRSGLTSAELVTDSEADDEEKEDELEPGYYTRYEARSDSSGLRRIPGSALRAHLDDSHPLSFGVGDRLYSLKFGRRALKPSESLQTVGYYDSDPASLLAAGYASKKNLKRLAGHAFAAVQPIGRGNVVFLVDNTQYRMFWVGPSRLVQNAVMLMPGM